MEKVLVVYWSGTGNTKLMAESVAQGAKKAGAEAVLAEVGNITVQAAAEYSRIAFGCPSMGDEVLEEGEMEPFFAEVEAKLHGKKIALFGSYGWGDGQWMRDWEARVKSAGADLCGGEGVICNDMPDEDALTECKKLGESLAVM
ncbi:MAG TPA: flavodoxin [Clostridia bacterium]|nr:flavodoxin [Clostridia bacterium]